MRLKLREVAAAALRDPRQALLDALGDTSGIEVFHNQVCVATYIAPPKIFKNEKGEDVEWHSTDKGQLEDRFQGKAALVIALGPLAFKDDNIAKFGGAKLAVGDWVMTRPSDGLEFFWGDGKSGVSCRLFDDTNIKARIRNPASIY